MEMENSRRSIDRSREPGLKKPRLALDAERDRSSNGIIDRVERPFPPRVSAAAGTATTGPQASRFRASDREGDAERRDPLQGVPYQPQQQQNQELVSRYKTALAELTFNSKPIITNLTIIAGENLHAAKWIAATVCGNILEVPSDQKLPSLYLLDSIVKNIGRDYIKYFAARLPEVFCKAYRQVDPSIHSGMRHLFGTWKGVFPVACLQTIEKELGFPPAANGSSSGATTSRADSQSQRPQHSIHVNPKYLEARRLQQSSRDLKQPQREVSREPAHEKSNSAEFEDCEYSLDFSRHSDSGFVRADERVTEQEGIDKPWYGTGRNATETAANQRNAFEGQREFSKYRAPKPAQAVVKLQPGGLTAHAGNRSNSTINRNWKNSEEEEYMWDDMNSRLTDQGGQGNPRKDGWTTNDAEKLEVEDNFMQPRGEHDTGSRTSRESSADSYSMTQRGQGTFGHRTSMFPLREPHTEDGLKHMGIRSRISGQSEGHPSSLGGLSASIGSSVHRTGHQTNIRLSVGDVPSYGSFVNVGSSGGVLGQQRHRTPQPISPSRHSPVQPNPNSPSSSAIRSQQGLHNFTEVDLLQDSSISQSGQKASQLVGQLNRAPPVQTNPDPFSIISKSHMKSGTVQNLQPTQIQPPRHMQASSVHFPPQRNHSSFSQQPHSDLRQSPPLGQIQKQLPQATFGTPSFTGHSVSDPSSNPVTDIPGQLSTGSLLAEIMKSGLLSNNSVSGGITNLNFQESGTVPSHLNIQPPLPSGPPPAQLTSSSTSMVTPVSLPPSHGRASSTTGPQRTAILPPLPPGPPPSSSVLSTSTQTGGSTNSEPNNPLSSLLSSLVAKGLISKPVKESPTVTAPQMPSLPQNQSSSGAMSCTMPVSSVPAPSTIPITSSGKDPPLSEPATKGATSLSQATAIEKKGLIGIEFKPEVIRESHPIVISGLFDDLPYRCNICGLRLQLQERFDRHLEWHASKKHESSSHNTMSRRWYASLEDWVTGSVGCSYSTILVDAEGSEPMVAADETQSVCVLCGELFEDFYSHERDEWMFKGATYMEIHVSEVGSMDGSAGLGPIVHAKCISPTSAFDLGLAKNIEKDHAE